MLISLEGALVSTNQRKTISGDIGLWSMVKEERAVLLACTKGNYPERLTYKMLGELSTLFGKFNSNHDLSQLEKNMKDLLKKYNSPESFDLLTQANSNVADIQNRVQENIDKLVGNQEQLVELEAQTLKMAENAQEFQKNTKKVERIMWWRKTKIQIMIALGVIGVIILILVLVKVT